MNALFECPICDATFHSQEIFDVHSQQCMSGLLNHVGYAPMIPTRVVNLRNEKFDVYIGRGSIWGNPFKIGQDGTREEVIEQYKWYILSREDLLDKLPELAGQRLGCFCKPEACHGDYLAFLADDK